MTHDTTPGETPASLPRQPSWRVRAATAGLVVVGIAMLAAGLVPWWLSSPARVSAWVARNVRGLHGAVEMRRATFTWSGPIVFQDVVIVPPGGKREPVTIRRIEAQHGIVAFLLSGGDCGRVRVEGLETHVVFDEDRDSNLAGLFYDPSVPSPPPAPPKDGGLRMKLEIEDALVRVEGPWSATPWISDPIDVRLELAEDPAGGAAWTLEPTVILTRAELEPSVAQGMLAYVAPVMADATSTSGRFSLAVDGGRFPVGDPQRASFAGTLTMHAVDLGPGPLVKGVLAALPGRIQTPPAIRIADDSRIAFRLENRRMWHEGLEMGVPLPRGRRLDLASSGWVGLDDQSLDLKLALPIPADMPVERPVLAALGGKTVSIGIVGRLGEPRADFDGSIRSVAADVAAGVIDRLLSRRTSPATPEEDGVAPSAPPPGPRPGWSPASGGEAPDVPERLEAPDLASDGDRKAADSNDGNAPTPAPPRPGWTPPRRPGTSPTAPSGRPGELAGDGDAKPMPPRIDAEGPAEGSTKPGAAQMLDELRDRIAPQTEGNPQAETVIDLVGGLIDTIAKRRAERAAAEAAAPPSQTPAPPPRRGRLLRRILQPESAPPVPAPQP